ncbi:hypothetical protein K502DRAFT_137239 [Neoconidiobolus thromboides FSU 785]|nr:hypothetical protein K502DRAFT_137239 [Neoconidiobolus thromboides FSU 785]
MQRGMPNKAKNQAPKANWSSVINQANLRNSPQGYAAQLQSYSDTSINSELNKTYRQSRVTRQEDFPALPLQRASSHQIQPKPSGMINDKTTPTQKQLNNSNMIATTSEQGGKNTRNQPRYTIETQAQGQNKQKNNKKEVIKETLPLKPEEKYGLPKILDILYNKKEKTEYFLATGIPLESAKLNLNDPRPIFNTLLSPWILEPSTYSGLSKIPDNELPKDFQDNHPMVSPMKHIKRYKDRTLFYIFYTMPRDLMQEGAAHELHSRGWRYHIKRQLWMMRVENNELTSRQNENSDIFEVFHPRNWETRIERVAFGNDTFETRQVYNINQISYTKEQVINNNNHHLVDNTYGPIGNPNNPSNGPMGVMNPQQMYKQNLAMGYNPNNNTTITPGHIHGGGGMNGNYLPQAHLNLGLNQQQVQMMNLQAHHLQNNPHLHQQQQNLPPQMFNANIHPNINNPHFNPNQLQLNQAYHLQNIPQHMLPHNQHHNQSRMKDY